MNPEIRIIGCAKCNMYVRSIPKPQSETESHVQITRNLDHRSKEYNLSKIQTELVLFTGAFTRKKCQGFFH